MKGKLIPEETTRLKILSTNENKEQYIVGVCQCKGTWARGSTLCASEWEIHGGNEWEVRVILAGLFARGHVGAFCWPLGTETVLFLVQGERFPQGKVNDLLSGRKGEVTEIFLHLSQVPLVENNQYAKVT